MIDSDTKIWLMKVTQESRSQSENLMYEKEPSISYFTNYNPNIEEIYYQAKIEQTSAAHLVKAESKF